MSGEVKLWRAVLRQAIKDIRSSDNWILKAQATRWFSRNNADFRMVCEFAQVVPERLERAVKRKFSRKK